jgi:protein required for attachment to host cells
MSSHAYRARHRAHVDFTDPAGTRIVVAGQAAAYLYDIGPGLVVSGAGRMVDAKARLHDRDFSSDRPGRVFDRAAPAGRRGAVAHHATNGERSAHRYEALRFARRIAAELDHGRRHNLFRRIVLVAEPRFLGQLREAMPVPLRRLIISQVRKELAQRPERAIKAHVQALLAQRDWLPQP